VRVLWLITKAFDAHLQGKEVRANGIHENQFTTNLRSSAAYLLHQPSATAAFSSRSFPVAAPTVRNKLSVNTRTGSLNPGLKLSWIVNFSLPHLGHLSQRFLFTMTMCQLMALYQIVLALD